MAKKVTAANAAKDPKSPKNLLSWFEESNSKWENVEDERLMLSKKELSLVVECVAKCYAGVHGNFVKLYLTIRYNGKLLSLKDDEVDGKRRNGVKLDNTSVARLSLDEGESIEVAPEKLLFYQLRNTEDGTTIRRVRVLK